MTQNPHPPITSPAAAADPLLCTILLVDDHDAFRERLAASLRRRGYDVLTAPDHAHAIEIAQRDSPELAIVDLKMPNDNGLLTLQAIKRIDPTTRVIVLTGYGSIATAVEAMRLGATNYLTKPADADQILAAFSPETSPDLPLHAPSLARAEWEHINRVLEDCQGNITQAAKLLGLHRRSLQRKLQKYPPP